jgi:hypothetical protein
MWKKQGNVTPPKDNKSVRMDFNDSEVDEIPDKEFKRMIIEIKENTINT